MLCPVEHYASQVRSNMLYLMPKRRRPIWEPTTRANFLAFLTRLRSTITPRPTVISGLFLALAIILFRDIFQDSLVIDPISVPDQMSRAGLTPEAVSYRMRDAVVAIEQEGASKIEKGHLAISSDQPSLPDIEVPQTIA